MFEELVSDCKEWSSRGSQFAYDFPTVDALEGDEELLLNCTGFYTSSRYAGTQCIEEVSSRRFVNRVQERRKTATHQPP